MIVTFLYRIKGCSQRKYGKYIGKCPIYEEGLDHALVELLYPVFQDRYKVTDISEISIGILSVDRATEDYFSEEEKNVFDVLYCKWPLSPVEIFFSDSL